MEVDNATLAFHALLVHQPDEPLIMVVLVHVEARVLLRHEAKEPRVEAVVVPFHNELQ